jgi:hypothetical protein
MSPILSSFLHLLELAVIMVLVFFGTRYLGLSNEAAQGIIVLVVSSLMHFLRANETIPDYINK